MKQSIEKSPIGRSLILISSLIGIASAIYFLFADEGAQIQTNTATLFTFESHFNKITLVLISLFSLALIWLLIRSILAKQKIQEARSLWVLAFFSIILLSAPSILLMPSLMISALSLCLMVVFFMNIQNQKNIQGLVFSASLLIGIAGIFFSYSLLFLLVFWVGLSILWPFRLKNYMSSIIGVVLPFVYYFGISYLFDLNYLPSSFSLTNTSTEYFTSPLNQISSILFLVYLGLALVAFLYNPPKQTMNQRSQMLFLIIFLCAAFLICLIFKLTFALILIGIPGSIFFLLLVQKFPKRWIFETFILIHLLTMSFFYFQ